MIFEAVAGHSLRVLAETLGLDIDKVSDEMDHYKLSDPSNEAEVVAIVKTRLSETGLNDKDLMLRTSTALIALETMTWAELQTELKDAPDSHTVPVGDEFSV